MTQDLLKTEFSLFDPAWIETETANGLMVLAQFPDTGNLRTLMENFFDNLSQQWLERPSRPDDLYRGALLIIRDLQRILNNTRELAIVRDSQEKGKNAEYKPWKMV